MTAPLGDPHRARAALLARLSPVASERVPLAAAARRVLAEPVCADRDSPPSDVSAMDGYAVRRADLMARRVSVAGEVPLGAAAPPLPPGQALRVMTGACVPPEAELVVMREDVRELEGALEVLVDPASFAVGQYIRRRGENLRAGGAVAPPGTRIGPQVAAALAAFGCARPAVHRAVRVALVVTGDELRDVGEQPAPWQIRDSNGPALTALLAGLPWVELVSARRAEDERDDVVAHLGGALDAADLVFVTGGVSMGLHDHVPEAVVRCGAEVLFHRLAIRPGKPVLGAIGPRGQAILGLPGNPVSVLTTARWLGVPALQRLAGLTPALDPPCVEVTGEPGPRAQVWSFLLARRTGPGTVALVASRGSGDLVAAAASDGFVEVAPDASPTGRWPFIGWSEG